MKFSTHRWTAVALTTVLVFEFNEGVLAFFLATGRRTTSFGIATGLYQQQLKQQQHSVIVNTRNVNSVDRLQASVLPLGNETSSLGASIEHTEPHPHHNTNDDRKKPFQPSGARTFEDSHVLNQAINKLALQAGDSRQPVVRRAAAAEDLWKEFTLSYGDGENTSNNDNGKTVRSDVVSFNTVLKAWGKAAQVLKQHRFDQDHDHLLDSSIPVYTSRECALHALDLLNDQEKQQTVQGDSDDKETTWVPKLDVNSYNTCMGAWCKSDARDTVEQVEDLLRRLQKSKTLQPDLVSYNALAEAHASSNGDERLEKLDKIWHFLEQEPSLQPSVRTMNTILNAYALKMKEIPPDKEVLAARAMKIFESLKQRYSETKNTDYLPDADTYATMIDVWSRVGSVEATRTAEKLLVDQIEMNIQPTAFAYTSLMKAWSRVSHSEEAQTRVSELLDTMIQDKNLQLNSHPFTACLITWSRSLMDGKAILALNTLKRMKELHVMPCLYTYNAALDCCAKTNDSDIRQHTVALKIAFAFLQSMVKDGVETNTFTYGKLLKCVENLLPPGNERNKIAVAAFEKARAAGKADVSVIKAFRKAAETKVVCTTVPEIAQKNGYLDYDRIPSKWIKNV